MDKNNNKVDNLFDLTVKIDNLFALTVVERLTLFMLKKTFVTPGVRADGIAEIVPKTHLTQSISNLSTRSEEAV